jgi:parvulin-like peptidyl-prolyl isomerase
MKRFMIFLSIFLLVSAAIFGQIDIKSVAVVRLSQSEQITVKQFRDYVNWLTIAKAMSTQNPNAKLTAAERRQALEELGNQFLACQAAAQEKISVSEKEITQYYEQSIAGFAGSLGTALGRAPTDAEIDTGLRDRTGMNRASFRELMKRTLLTENYLKVKKQSLFTSIKEPTEAEIQKIHGELKDKSIFEYGFSRPDTTRIRMLLIPFRSPTEKAKAQTTANTLFKSINGDPGKFDEAARDFRKPNSGYVSGDGYVYKDDRIRQSMGADFVNTVFNLKQGEVSKLLEGNDGYYIIKVIETYRAKVLALDDIYNLEDPRGTTVRQAISAAETQGRFMAALQQATDELVGELRKKGSIQIMDDIYNQITW